MPKIKEVLHSEVHWQIGKWNIKDQANVRIRQYLGDDASLFAPVYVSYGSYEWKAPAAEWRSIPQCSLEEQAEVRQVIAEAKERAKKKVPNDLITIDMIFNVPNDDFIFCYRDSVGALKVMLAGWGFANYKQATGGGIIDKEVKNNLQNVTLGFSIDGIRVPYRKFELKAGMGVVEKETDGDGIFDFGTLLPGSVIEVRDTATDKKHTETVTDNTAYIDVDVTEFVEVRVQARLDGQPLSDGSVAHLIYGHRTADMSVANGSAVCLMPWLEGKNCEVELRGESQQKQLEKGQANVFNFEFLSPVIEKAKVTVNVTSNGMPVVGEPVVIESLGVVNRLQTDASGRAVIEFELPDGWSGQNIQVKADVRECTRVERLASKELEIDFTFDTEPDIVFDPVIKVVSINDEIFKSYPISVEYDGITNEYLTNSEGRVLLNAMVSGREMTAIDTQKPTIRTTYRLDHHQKEYIFRLPYEVTPGNGDVTLRVIGLNKKPMVGLTVILSQDDVRITATLDEQGEMHFSSDDFEYDKPVVLNMYSDSRTFPEIKFDLVEGETEYEFVEVPGPQLWWKKLGEIVALVAVVAGLYFSYICMKSFIFGFNSSLEGLSN